MQKRATKTFAVLPAVMCLCAPALATETPFKPNYDEAQVPAYTLPDPLLGADGKPVTSARQWERQRRGEVLALFEDHVYGRMPARPQRLRNEVTSVDSRALQGKATRKEVTLFFSEDRNGPKMDLLIYLPNHVRGPVPLFAGLNFFGNHTLHADPGITISTNWMRANAELGIVNHRATEASRGMRAERWQVEKILARGYGIATAYYGDLEPDHPEGWQTGVRSRIGMNGGLLAEPRTRFESNDWGAIGAWAWGLSRAMDYFETDSAIDHRRVVLIGHSRLGKTALWAGAQDRRFAIVISNNSGCGGAALSRRRYGETVARINSAFPHWFCGQFKTYKNREDTLPVDQHMLVSLIAPRPVYVASAEEDRWADPKGEFLSAKQAEPVYRLFGKRGTEHDEMPPVNRPVGETIGYHCRAGKHDVTAYDWDQYLVFADRHFRKRMQTR